MVKQKETRTFRAHLDSLEDIRNFLGTSAKSAGLDKNKTYKIKLAIDEIATNIINYGYGESAGDQDAIVLTTVADTASFTVILEDHAVPFNPLQRKLPEEQELSAPLEDRKIGGLGIMLARQNVDSFNYEYKHGKNRNIFSMMMD